MIIQIITEREIEDKDYWLWVESTLSVINRESRAEFEKDHLTRQDFVALLDNRKMSFEDDLGYTKAKTTYKIIEEEERK